MFHHRFTSKMSKNKLKGFVKEREREREREKKKKKGGWMDGWRKRKRYENHKKKIARVCVFFFAFFPFFFFVVWLIITGEKERDFLVLVEHLCATTIIALV